MKELLGLRPRDSFLGGFTIQSPYSLRSLSSFSLNALSSKLEAIHEKSPTDFV